MFDEAPILNHFDLECHIYIESYVFDYVIDRILSELISNNLG